MLRLEVENISVKVTREYLVQEAGLCATALN